MLDLHGTLLATTAVVNVGLALFVYTQGRTSPINGSFALFTLFLSAWSLSVLAFLNADTDSTAVWYFKLAYLSAALIAGSYYCFSLVFASSVKPHSTHVIAVVAATLILCVILLIPGFLAGSVIQHDWGREVILDPVDYLIFAVLFSVLFVGAQIRLWWKYVNATGLVRRQLLAIGASVTPIGLLGMYFNLVLISPFISDFRQIWAGPVLTSIFAVIITYSVFRYQLFSTKAIVAEILVFALWLLIFVRILLTAAVSERLANVLLLIVAIPIGVLLLRGVRVEVRARENLALANTRLTELDREKTEFLSMATHQLRTPVTVIRGYAENLRDGTYGALSHDAMAATHHIADRARALAIVIDDYLDVSRIELGRMKYDFQVADASAIVERVVEELSPAARSAGLDLVFDGQPSPWQAKIDAGKIAKVAFNLIDNAIKYTRKGSIHVRLEHARNQLVLSVRDTGMGIDSDALKKLFQKFSRGQKANEANKGGTGLGLYVAAQLVSAHGGRIWAESAGTGRGATFYVSVPVNGPFSVPEDKAKETPTS